MQDVANLDTGLASVRRESRTTQRRRYDRRAVRLGENSRGFITVAQPTERRPFFLAASWTFVSLDPREVLWDTGAQEGLVGKQQLDKWCQLLAEHCLQVEWSQEKPESASGIGGVTQPIGVVYVPVGLAGYNCIIRCTVVEQDVPPLLPVGIMRTLQASLDLTDDGDKVIFRQLGGEFSIAHFAKRTHGRSCRPICSRWLAASRNHGVDAQQITCQSSHTCTRDPEAWTTIHQQETMTQHPHEVADHGRRQHPTTTDLPDLRQQSLPLHHLGSRVVNTSSRCHQSLRGSTAWNIVDDQTVETTRALHGVRAMRGILRHPVSGISDADPHGTIGGHPACIATTGATRDEGQVEQCCEFSRGSVGARQSLTERQPVNLWKKAPNDCDHPPTAIQKGGNAVMCCERCEMCGNRWQRIHLTMVARDPETKLNNRTVLASSGKRPVEIERPFCPHGHGSMMMQATPQQSLYWEWSTCSTTSGLRLDGCDVRDANMVPTGDDETPCSERAGAAEGCGPGGLSPIDL